MGKVMSIRWINGKDTRANNLRDDLLRSVGLEIVN